MQMSMTGKLSRLFNPASLAVIGGGAWGAYVIEQAQKFGYSGDIWPIHPSKIEVAGLKAFSSIRDLPSAPDASFIGINRDATIGAAERLNRASAGGAVCFASGFAEAQAEDEIAGDAQDRLLKAAGDMPILGPNCYGFINALDGAIIWPDQHGMSRVDRGVAILTQSSNIAINLTFQTRCLPIAMMVTCGNMAQTSQAAIIDTLLDDDRITAIGLHIEGFTDLTGWQAVAQKAHDKDIPLIALKAGRSAQARAATQSHTASLAGEDAGAQALLEFLGIGRVNSLSELLETLKLAHVCGRLASPTAASISCSGGEASLAADLGQTHGVTFPPLTDTQHTNLRAALGPKVALANPLDYHTYIWRDTKAMTAAWSAITAPDIAVTMTIVDIPDPARANPVDWQCAIDAAVATHKNTGANVAFVSSLPETLPAQTSAYLMEHGIAPMQGLSEALAAIPALVRRAPSSNLMTAKTFPLMLERDELETKQALQPYDLKFPRRVVHSGEIAEPLAKLTYPVVVKGSKIAHKTENDAVILNLMSPEDALAASAQIHGGGPNFIEEMAQGGVAELLIGFTNDPAHGIMLTLGAGGTLTELMQDTQHLMLPVTADAIDAALSKLRIAPMLDGYRGKPAADRAAIIRTVLALQQFVRDNQIGFVDLEVNPLICTPKDAVVVDALWHQSFPEKP
jgi:acyl-CoA synthetase (NDP forming)